MSANTVEQVSVQSGTVGSTWLVDSSPAQHSGSGAAAVTLFFSNGQSDLLN